MKYLKIVFSFLILTLLHTNVSGQVSKNQIILPLGGNAFSSLPLEESNTVTDNGIENWTNPEEQFTVYFKVSKPGLVKIALNEAITIQGKSVLEFGINNTFKKIKFSESKKTPLVIGEWKIKDTGYVALKIKAISKTKTNFPSFSKLAISGSQLKEKQLLYLIMKEAFFIGDDAGHRYI